MAISNRLRYEIFRRDNHACRYCGAMAPDAKLTVDHVVPVALGGADTPDNLATACDVCNSGKSSTPADAALVVDVAQDALRWRRAIEAANEMAAKERAATEAVVSEFLERWNQWTRRDPSSFNKRIPFRLPGGWEQKVREIATAGLPVADICDAVDIAMDGDYVNDKFAYFIGVCRQRLAQRQQIAAELLRRGVIE